MGLSGAFLLFLAAVSAVAEPCGSGLARLGSPVPGCRIVPKEARVSQPSVERALGKLLTDEGFRAAFFRDPWAASRSAGLELAAEEVDALWNIPARELTQLCRRIDDRICRLWVCDPAEQEKETGS